MHVVQVGAGLGDVLEGVGARADVMGIVGTGDVRQHLEGDREYDVGVDELEGAESAVPSSDLGEPRSLVVR